MVDIDILLGNYNAALEDERKAKEEKEKQAARIKDWCIDNRAYECINVDFKKLQRYL